MDLLEKEVLCPSLHPYPPLQGRRRRRKRKVVREKIRRGKKGGREGDSPKQVDKEKEELSPSLLSWHSVVGRAEKGGGDGKYRYDDVGRGSPPLPCV